MGESTIPADWSNLVLRSPHIANAEGIVGLPEGEAELVEEDITAHELAVIAAEQDNLTAGLTLVDAPPTSNGIVSNRASNPITVNVANLGLDAHTFNVVARYEGGQTAPTPVTLAGVEDVKNHARDIAIDLGPMPGVQGRETSVGFVITNEKSATVFAEEFGLPLLDCTATEAAKVLKDVEASADSAAQKQTARGRLQPVAQLALANPQTPPTTTTAKPADRPAQPPIERPKPKPTVTEAKAPAAPATDSANGGSDGSSVDGGVIAGIVLGSARCCGCWLRLVVQQRRPAAPSYRSKTAFPLGPRTLECGVFVFF